MKITFTSFAAPLFFLFPALLTAQTTELIKTFGGNHYDAFNSIHQTNDGFILCGQSMSFGDTLSDVYLVKTDNEGNLQWQKTFGGNKLDGGNNMIVCRDGSFLIAGHTESYNIECDGIVIKTDASGNELWTKTFGDEGDDVISGAAETADGNFLLAGFYEHEDGNTDVNLIKLNPSGEILFNRNFGGPLTDIGNKVVVTADGSIYIAGNTLSHDGDENLLVLKTDEDGNQIWLKTFGGNGNERAYSIIANKDGSLVIAGGSNSFSNGTSDLYALKIDADGNELWSHIYGSDNDDNAYCMIPTPDDGYIITGFTDHKDLESDDLIILKTDASGNEQWRKIYGEVGSSHGTSIIATANGNYAVTGHWGKSADDIDGLFMRTDGSGVVLSVLPVPSASQVLLSPNPMHNEAILNLGIFQEAVQILLFNVIGNKVAETDFIKSEQLALQRNGLPDGIYFYTVINKSRSFSYSGKIVME